MLDETIVASESEATDVSNAVPDKPKDAREVSTIGFPYHDLQEAIRVANAILAAGGRPLARDQLAGAMGLAVNSGNFTNKTAAARLFGLIETVAGRYQLTRLGFDILDKDGRRTASAKATAFLNVPLYKKTYEAFRNGQLPPRPLGLENAFASFGVSSKQTDKARRIFDNSARDAGFFEHGNDKLIAPIVGPSPSEGQPPPLADAEPAKADYPAPEKVKPRPQGASEHPFVQGLLITLPELGENWSAPDRVKWLQAAATAFELMFKGGAPINIGTKVEPTGEQ